MIVLGVALLAACTLAGAYLGDLLGHALGVKANVGGVGIAMILLIGARVWLARRGRLGRGVTLGVEFWAGMYIPIVVAMAAQQNVVAAVSGGPIVLIAAAGSLALCFAAVALISRIGRRDPDPAPGTPPGTPEAAPGGEVVAGRLRGIEAGIEAGIGAGPAAAGGTAR